MQTKTIRAALAAICVAAALPSWAATWLDGASGNLTDDACWDGGTAPTSGSLTFANTSGNVSYVTNNVSGTSWSGDCWINSGAWEFSGAFPKNSNGVLFGSTANKTVTVVNYSDWSPSWYMDLCHESGTTVVMTNRAGTITAYGSGGASGSISIGGKNSTTTGANATLVFEGGTMIARTKNLVLAYGKSGTKGTLVQKGGEIRVESNANFLVGGYGEGVFVQDGGTFSVASGGHVIIASDSAADAASHITLNGGEFAVPYITYGSCKVGTSTMTLDGGTLKLTASSSASIARNARLAVKVGEHGGRIVLGEGVAGVVPADIGAVGATDGGLTIGGAGSLSFTGTLGYTGATTVELGATMIVPSPSTIPGAFVVTIPATPSDDGMYTILTTTGEDTLETLFASATLPTGDPKAVFRLSADKKSIICLYGDVEQTWIGGASGDLGDEANWSTGLVPKHGNAVITSGSAATLTSNAEFTPDAITFPEESALITINGEAAIANLLAVTNNSALHHVFNCPVSFKDGEAADITVTSSQYVKFTGGMTAYTLKQTGAEAYISGNITLTKDIANWAANVEIDLLHLCDGATLTIPRSVTVDGTANFKLDSGTTLNIEGDISASAYFTSVNNGVVNVSGRAISTGSNVWQAGSGSGIMKASGLVSGNSSSRFVLNTTGNWIVGQDGMTAAKDFYTQTSNSSHIYPYSDFTMSGSINNAGSGSPKMYISTTDYYDSTVKRVVTINAGGGGRYALTVNGIGTALFIRTTTFASSLTANDSVTVAVNDGCRPGNGAVTMNGTSTLKVAQSGTVTLGGNLTLASTAALAFNFTDKATAPRLAIPAASTIPTTVNVKISAKEGIRPSSSQTHTLTSTFDFTGKTVNIVDKPDWVKSVDVVEGNLVLTVKPKGMLIVVK